jgi:hypothetical protein
MTILVRFILHGLIAFVPYPDSTGSINHLNAILVNAMNPALPQQFKDCVAPHTATLTFPVATGEPMCGAAGCVLGPNGDRCTCTFFAPSSVTSKRIWITPDPSPAAPALPKTPPSELPSGAPNFSYIPNLLNLGYTFNQQYVGASPPSQVVRMEIPAEQVIPCHLSTRTQDKQTELIHTFHFRKLNDYDVPSDKGQALVQMLVIKTNYQVAAGSPLSLNIGDAGSTTYQSIPIAQNSNVDIFLANSRGTASLDLDDPCNDGIGRDFALFSTLTNENPAPLAALLPHVRQSVTAPDFEATECSTIPPSKMPDSRPICPMATFN